MLNLKTIDLKKEIKELIENDPGKERGEDIKYLISYVKQKKGDDGLKKVKAELKRCGYELPDISKIDNMGWIPSSLPTIFMLTSAKVFNWQEEDIIALGKEAVSFKLVLKLFIKYFVSVEKTFKMGARRWREHYTFGEAELVRCDLRQKRVVARIKNFKKHPITCIYLAGVFSMLFEIATGSKNITVKETKCEFRGDPYHEFEFKWE